MLYLSRASQHPHNAATVINHVGGTLVAAAPTGIPTVIITSILRCVTDLEKHGITVQSTLKIKDAAAVEVVVLDKTGTITGSVVSCCSLYLVTLLENHVHTQHEDPAECTLLFLSQGTKGHWVFTSAACEDCSSDLSDPTACLWRSTWAAQGHQHC